MIGLDRKSGAFQTARLFYLTVYPRDIYSKQKVKIHSSVKISSQIAEIPYK